MKVIKGIVKIVGIVASIAAMIPGPHQPVAAIVAAVASAVSVALEVIAPMKAKSNARGSPTEYQLDPQTGIPIMLGRTQYAGTGVKRETWGKDNKWQCFTSVYSLGPIQSIDTVTMDRTAVTFDGSFNVNGAMSGFMWYRSQLGAQPSPILPCPSPEGAAYPGWTASRLMSGLAASHWVMKFDKDGDWFTSGPPTPGIVGKGVKVYDPRLDSTYPGGVGACRANQPNTYVFSETPHLHALTYALGYWQNGKRRGGIGFPVSAIDIPYFVNAANVDEANGWKISGVIFTTDPKWNTLKMMMEAGGGQPITTGGKLSGVQSAPRVAVATITSADVVGKCSLTGTQSQRNRINGVTPRIRSEAHGWEMISLDPVRVPAYEVADGRQRTRELEWTLVNLKKQAAQLSSYFIMNAREFGPIELTVKMRWIGLRSGDCVNIDIPELNLINQKAVLISRSFDVEKGAVLLTLRSENDAKHTPALASNGTAPPDQNLSFNADVKPAAPAAGSWTLSVGALASSSGTVPSLRFAGAVDNETASAVEFTYRRVGTTEWFVSQLVPPNTIRVDETAVIPGQAYEARVRYNGAGKWSNYLALGPITVEAAAAGTATIANSIVGQGSLATLNGVTLGTNVYRSGPPVIVNDSDVVTNLGTAAGISGQGPWATTTQTIRSITGPGVNFFPYPRGTYDGRTPAELGFINTDYSASGMGHMFIGQADWLGGRYYGYSGNITGPLTMFPVYDVVTDATWVSGLCSVSMDGYATGAGSQFAPYFEFRNGANNAVVGSATTLSYNANTNRWEGTTTVPAGAVILRIVFRAIWSVAGGASQIVFWNVKAEAGGQGVTPYSEPPDVITRPGGLRRLGDGRNLNTNWNFGLTQLRSSPGFSDVDAGTTATINISASSYMSDWGTTISLPSGSLPGLAFVTKYYIWRIQPDPTTAGTSYACSVNLLDALGPGKSYLGYFTTRADGGGAGGGGGGWGGQDCVDAEAFVLCGGAGRKAFAITPGEDELTVLDEETMEGVTSEPVVHNHFGLNERVRLTTESGIQLTLSINTPITLRDRSIIRAFQCVGELLPVLDHGKFRWERVTKLEAIGVGSVAHIYCNDKTYAAGDEPGRYILTHNQIVYK